MTDASAKWIWRGDGDPQAANRFTWFRTVVDLREPQSSSTLRFAANSTARLWVNGALVRRKVTRFSEPNVRADVVPVARHLRPGRNVILALHHNWGDIVTFQRTGNSHAGLFIESDWVHTDESWRWLDAPELGTDVEQFEGVAGGAPRIRYPIRWDARRSADPAAYLSPHYDDSAWGQAAVVVEGPWPDSLADVETPAQRESFQLPLSLTAAGTAIPFEGTGRSRLAGSSVSPNEVDALEASALVRGGEYRITGEAGETRYVTVDLQRAVHGYPRLDLGADADVRVDIGYGELAVSTYSGATLVSADGWIDVDGVVANDYSDTVWPASERRTYEIPDERTARWITVHVTFATAGTLTIHSLGMVKSQYPIEFRGSFSCGDDRIDQVVALALTHAEATMSDAYVDTPGREDGQWIEDARPRAILASRWFGDIRLRRMMIRTLAEGQRPDGNLHPFFPSNYPYGPAQWDWSLQWVGMVADDYRWTADSDFVTLHIDAIERFWAAIAADIGADGIWRSSWVFGDLRNAAIVEEGGSSGIVTPWIVDRLRDSAELADAAGRPERADEWRMLAERVAAAFRILHLTSDNPFGVRLVADAIDASGTPCGFSQAGQIIPSYDGLLTPTEAAAAMDVAFPAPDGTPPPGLARWNNPTWSYRALRALSVNGRSRRAVAHLLERYSPFLPGHPDNEVEPVLQGPRGGPLPEYWISRADQGLADDENNERQPIDPTGSHGWGAVPLLWLHEYLLGVTIAAPGGDRLEIRPDAAGLPFVGGTTVTPRGAVYLHFEPSEPRLRIELPAGVSARLTLPAEFAGTVVNEAAGRVHIADAAEPVTLSEGTWEFASVGAQW